MKAMALLISLRRVGVVGLLTLAVVAGCGPSREERANAHVERLTRRAATLFEKGQLDDAQRAVDEALAVEEATQQEQAIHLARRIGTERRRVDTEQFTRQAPEALDQAVALAEQGNAASAVALLGKLLPQTSGVQQELARSLIQRVEQLADDNVALRYWKMLDPAAMVDVREKDRLPDDWQAAVADGPPYGDALRRLWRATLRRTMPTALANAELLADRVVDPDYLLPTPTIEEVAADPWPWVGKQVRFPGVWVNGQVITSMKHGRLLTVRSPAGKVYEPTIETGVLVFSTYGDVARRFQSLVAPDQRAQGCLFCKIVRARQLGMSGAASFYQAMVYKIELYAETPEGGPQR